MSIKPRDALSIPWVVSVRVASGFTGLQMSVPPPPRGDEIFQTFGLGIMLFLFGLVAAAFRSGTILNAALFTVLFWCAHLSLWFKVARNYGYAVWAAVLGQLFDRRNFLCSLAYVKPPNTAFNRMAPWKCRTPHSAARSPKQLHTAFSLGIVWT